MKDGPERDFKQSLKDRRDESIGATESDLVDRLFKSVQDAFSPGSESGRTMSDRDLRTLSDQDLSGRTLSDADLAIGRTISDQDLVISRPQLIRDEIEQGRYGLSKGRTFSDNDWGAVLQGADPAALLSEKGDTISDRDRAIISGLLSGVRVPPIEIKETSEVITESPEGAIALDETMQLPSAMELARMGMGLGSRKTPPLQEGLGGFGFQPHQLPTPERLSPYEEMLMLASLGIPVAGLAGRAVGGLMRGMKGRGIPARNEEALEKILNAPSAMRDMGPQAGNITGGAIALEKLGRPISGNITAGARGLHPFRSYAGDTARKGLESLRKYHPRMPKILSKEQDTAYRLGIDSAKNLKLNQKILKRYEELAPKIANQLKKENANLGKIVNSSEGQKFEALARYKEYIEAGAPFDISPSDLKWLLK
jgi:hypothetical protein